MTAEHQKRPFGRLKLSSSFCALGLAAIFLVMTFTGAIDRSTVPVDLTLSRLQPTTFQRKVEMPGVIEPLSSREVISDCLWSTRILSIVPEGTIVSKGDVVCVLDASEIEEYARTRELTLIKYQNRLAREQSEYELLAARNERRLDGARFQEQSSRVALDTYSQGTFPQEVEAMENNLRILAEQSNAAREDLEHAQNLWAQGMVSRREVGERSLRFLQREQQFTNLEAKLRLTNEFTDPRARLRLEYTSNDSKREVLRTEISNSLTETDSRRRQLSYERIVQKYQGYYDRAMESIAACQLKAPCDGQIVLGNSWYLQSRGITQIEEGKTVRYRQKIFEIPDPTRLKVTVRVHESMIHRIHRGMPVLVKLRENDEVEIPGAINWIGKYPQVRSSYTPSVKDYTVDVELLPETDEQRDVLRPKADVEVAITLVEKRDVLSIPRDAVVGIAGDNFVWAWVDNSMVARQVKLGEANDEVVCIEDGVQPGDQIAIDLTNQHLAALREILAESLDLPVD